MSGNDNPGEGSSSSSHGAGGDEAFRPRAGPQYMQVGTGHMSESAHRLAQILDEDSGYGGSIASGDFNHTHNNAWHPGLGSIDQPTPSHTPTLPGEYNPAAERERRVLASHVHQLYYNQNKNALGRAINETVEVLGKLREMNGVWPAHYPTVRPETPSPSKAAMQDPRPGLIHTQSTLDNHREAPELSRPGSSGGRPGMVRRAETTIGHEVAVAESSASAGQRTAPEPRLVTPQLAQELSVLKIDLKLGHLKQSELVHSLEKGSIAALLDGQIEKSINHLYALRERIDDTASKVLVTGDLNAGKSTFCNALLRRQILPVDQQPCTSIFCEVLHVEHNSGVEEVHAVPLGSTYNRNDERTYRVFAIKDLEKIVVDDEKWSQCKVYVKDIRSVGESLLNNGVVDIALIDAPGLNKDSVITTANFAKQEEIDVVVFVVSAANHFTESAKEFVFNAAREKAYMFIVVNGFDAIRDKKRAQNMILKQVRTLSPATFKESAELVHFVSSNAIPTAPPPGGGDESLGGSGGGGGGSGSGGFDEDPDDGDEEDEADGKKHKDPPSPVDKGKGKDKEKIRDFTDLEASLRRFVLEKRSRSKLAPAKTYLINVLGDLDNLAQVNRDVAQKELDRVNKELAELMPQLEDAKKGTNEADKGTDHTIEDTVTDVYKSTRETLTTTIYSVGTTDHGIEYPGFLGAFQYAEDLKWAMLQTISDTVTLCEENARQKTVTGVNMIKNLGVLHLGNNFPDLSFRPEKMFTRQRDALARQVDVDVDFGDFFDLQGLWERQEKIAGGGMALTVAGIVGGRLMGGAHWIDGAVGAVKIMGVNNVRRLLVPSLIATVIVVTTYALSSIPTSLPRRLSAKLSQQLMALDYTHNNATRISSEVRRALKYPAENLRVGLRRNLETLETKRQDTDKIKKESSVAVKYFANLVGRTGELRRRVSGVDLEGPAPGVAAEFES